MANTVRLNESHAYIQDRNRRIELLNKTTAVAWSLKHGLDVTWRSLHVFNVNVRSGWSLDRTVPIRWSHIVNGPPEANSIAREAPPSVRMQEVKIVSFLTHGLTEGTGPRHLQHASCQ